MNSKLGMVLKWRLPLCGIVLLLMSACANNNQYLAPFENDETRLFGILGHGSHHTSREWVVSPRASVCVLPVAVGGFFPLDDGYRAQMIQKHLQQALGARFYQVRSVQEGEVPLGCQYSVNAELINLKDRPNLWEEVADDPGFDFVGGDEVGFKLILAESVQGQLLDVTFVSTGNAWLVSSEDHMGKLIRSSFDLYAQYLTPSGRSRE